MSCAALCGLDSSAFTQCALAVIFVLMFFEMTTIPRPMDGLSFDRYVSRNARPIQQALRDDTVTVALTRDGTIYFRNFKVTSDELSQRLRESLRAIGRHKVFLIIDQRAKFGDVSPVLDALCHAQVWNIAFLTELEATRSHSPK